MSLHEDSNRIISESLTRNSGSYSVDVSYRGKLLFRTEEQPTGVLDNDMEKCLKHLTAKFLKSEGYEVQVVMWPNKVGTIRDVTK